MIFGRLNLFSCKFIYIEYFFVMQFVMEQLRNGFCCVYAKAVMDVWNISKGTSRLE
jgi:hypothetical protein